MLQICPICGGVMSGSGRYSAFRDSELFAAEDEALSGCLCFKRLVELESAIMGFQERLKKALKERFPGKRKAEILQVVLKLDRDAPLRVDVLRRFSMLDRAREHYKKRKTFERTEEQVDQEFQDAHERGITSEELPLNTWFKSYRKKSNQ